MVIVDGGSTDKTHLILQKYKYKLDLKVILDDTPNFGVVRNTGASLAERDILFECNTDNVLPPNFLKQLFHIFQDPCIVAVSGRVYPLGTSVIAHIAYQFFDFLRFTFTYLPFPAKKFRPSGSFLGMRKYAWSDLDGFPEVTVNEDGLMGGKIEQYIKKYRQGKVKFRLDMFVGHHVKKFESMGGIHALLFYLYTLTNFAPMLKPLLKHVEFNASQIFQHKKVKRLGVRDFWNWL